MVSRRQVIDSPTTFTPLPFGLMSVATMATSDSSHWQNGVTYRVRCNNNGNTTYDECITVTGAGDGAVPAPPDKFGNVEMDFRGATPFTVYTKFECSPVGITDAQKIAEDAMAQTFPWQIERALWTGNTYGELADGTPVVRQVVYPSLVATTSIVDSAGILLQSPVVTGDAGDDTVCALGFLEQSLGNCYNGVGVIHVSRRALPALLDRGLVESRGPVLYTKGGNMVAVGSGYADTGPAGASVTQCQSWMYATGPVFVYNGQTRVTNFTESFDRSKNTVEMLAEKTALVGWGCCHYGVRINVSSQGNP